MKRNRKKQTNKDKLEMSSSDDSSDESSNDLDTGVDSEMSDENSSDEESSVDSVGKNPLLHGENKVKSDDEMSEEDTDEDENDISDNSADSENDISIKESEITEDSSVKFGFDDSSDDAPDSESDGDDESSKSKSDRSSGRSSSKSASGRRKVSAVTKKKRSARSNKFTAKQIDVISIKPLPHIYTDEEVNKMLLEVVDPIESADEEKMEKWQNENIVKTIEDVADKLNKTRKLNYEKGTCLLISRMLMQKTIFGVTYSEQIENFLLAVLRVIERVINKKTPATPAEKVASKTRTFS